MNVAIKQLFIELGINKLQFAQYKNAILSHLNLQINKCKNKFQHPKYKSILNNTSVKEALEKLQHYFLVVQIDRAANKVSFICKRFYATTLLKEVVVIGTPNKMC